MEYRILGPLELADAQVEVGVTGARQRALLALLLIHRNEVVSSERIIDALWGATPPPSAVKALHNAVSQVRRSLASDGDGPLRTERAGYVLLVAPGELDADRFEGLVDTARRSLAAGDAAPAAQQLREALALWRGPALADLAYEAFAQPEIARLEELRLVALEERVDADLALGRHDELTAELEAEIARHPLRERLRAQQMLALYRAGRQAEALEAFQEARGLLVEELGIEPGPALRQRHEAILRQDPALDAARAPPRLERGDAGRSAEPSRGRVALLAGGVLLAAAVAAALVVTREDDRPAAAGLGSVAGNSLVAIDPRTGRVVASYPTGSTPTAITAGASGIWALNGDDRTLTRVDRRTSAARTFAVPDTPVGIAAGANSVWALTGTPGNYIGPVVVPRRLVELSPATGVPMREIALPVEGDPSSVSLNRIALGRDRLWAIASGEKLLRLDPAAAGPPEPVGGVRASDVVASGGGAWAIAQSRDSEALVRVTGEGRVAERVPIASTGLDGLGVGAGAVWATAPQDGLLWRVTRGATRSIRVGAGARGVAVAGGAVWVANAARGTVMKVDPRTERVAATVRIGNAPRGLASDGQRLWVTVAEGGGTAARDAARTATGAVTASACAGVLAGATAPQRLIVSDLPLQRPGVAHLSDAIGFVLRRHGFQAGRFTIGYQSCDDSTAQQGDYEDGKCRANASAYAHAPRVVGIVGPFNSGCTFQQLPITNSAPGGPLAMISPTNTAAPLTRPVPGEPPDQLTKLYPTGRRHFSRLMAPDDAQGMALARFAQEHGWRRLALVHNPFYYGRAIASGARGGAHRSGTRVVLARPLDYDAGKAPARALARRVAAARPDALLFAGLPSPSSLTLVRDVRARLGAQFPVLIPDAWLNEQSIFAALGPVVRGIYGSSAGIPPERLGAAGRQFVKEFGATQPGGVVTADAVYAAQATEVMLAAIARSDGSRASVTRALLATDLRGGLVGDVRFDLRGDVHPRPFTIVRLTRNTGTTTGVVPGGQNIAAIVSP
jgi:DNA-binding SARP family transcriptional activator